MIQTPPDLSTQRWRKHAAPLAFAIVGAVAAAVVACPLSTFYFGRLIVSASRKRRPWVVVLTCAFPPALFATGYAAYVAVYQVVEGYPYSLSFSGALGGVAFLFPPYMRFVYLVGGHSDGSRLRGPVPAVQPCYSL